MPIDPGIYGALGVKPKSLLDYQNELAKFSMNRLAQQEAALGLRLGQQKADEYARGVQEQGTLRNALAGLQPGAGYDERINALEGTNLPSGYAQADTLRKAMLEQRKGAAAAGKDESAARGQGLEQTIKAHEFHVQKLGAVADPQTAMQWAQEGLQTGVFTPEQFERGMQALQQAAQSPQTFEQWKQQALQGGLSATEQLKAKAAAEKLAEDVRQFGVRSTETATAHRAMEADREAQRRIAQGHLGVAQGQLGVARERLNTEKTAPKGVWDSERGMLIDPRTGAAVQATLGGVPIGPKSADTGKPLAAAVVKQVSEARDNAATLERLTTSFKPEFAGKGVFGLGADAQMAVSANVGKDRDAVDWWKNYRKSVELVERHALFGAALTPTEQASWRSADISPGMDAKVVRTNLETRAELTKKVLEATQQDMVDAGHSEGRVRAIGGRGAAPPADTAQRKSGAVSGGLTVAEKAELAELKRQFGR